VKPNGGKPFPPKLPRHRLQMQNQLLPARRRQPGFEPSKHAQLQLVPVRFHAVTEQNELKFILCPICSSSE
jgi:hypothetical protein